MEKSVIKIKNFTIKQDYLAFLMILGALLSVCLIPDGFTKTRLENLLLPFIIINILLYKSLQFDKVFSILILLFFLSSLFSSMINKFGFSEMMYCFRFFKFFLFFIMTCHVVKNNMPAIDFFIKFIFIILLIINTIQILNPFNLSDYIGYFYPHHKHLFSGIGISSRLFGTMVNPNDNGVLWIIFVVYFMSKYFYKKKIHDLIYLSICVLAIFLTQSRTAFIALLTVSILYLLCFKIKMSTLLFFSFILSIGLIFIYILNLKHLMQVFFNNPLEIHSFQLRYEVWQKMIEIWKHKILFGYGYFKQAIKVFGGYPDNEYFNILVKQGIIGLLLYISIFLYPFIIFWKKRKQVYHALLGILMPAGLSVFAITNFTIMNVRLGLLYFVFMGISFSMLLHYQEKKQSDN